MLKKIKEYFTYRKLRREAATLILLNTATIITAVRNLSDFLNDTVKEQSMNNTEKNDKE